MTYTILSAQYANEDSTAAVLHTEEVGLVLASKADTPDLWAELMAWGEPSPYAPSPEVVRYSKRKLFGAMSDAQFVTFKQYQAQQPERMQAVFDSAVELSSADPDWPQFLGLMDAAYGKPEAKRLLDAARI